MRDRQEEYRRALEALGFDVVRFTRVDSPLEESASAFQTWLAEGAHADMAWIAKSPEKRRDPRLVLPGARSAVLLGVNYGTAQPPGREARWARYALYDDYHDTIRARLIEAAKLLETTFALQPTDHRYYVDTGPVLERALAEHGGLGFIGKNSMLISRDFGNWLFLAEILTTAEFVPDQLESPKRQEDARVGLLCGKCTRCSDSCPTGAIVAPGKVDARLCISYHTIENRGIIPRELRAKFGNRVYGCDTCLDVCPWNRFAQEGRSILLRHRREFAGMSLRDLLRLDAPAFAETFRGTPIKRTKLAGLIRNVCIAAANTRAMDCLPDLVSLCRHESPIVRAHAVWAVYSLVPIEQAGSLLATARDAEREPVVLAEYEAAEQT